MTATDHDLITAQNIAAAELGHAPGDTPIASDAAVPVAFRVLGLGLIACAASMWAFPGQILAPEVLSIKLVASIFLMLCGLGLLMPMRNPPEQVICYDPESREFRVLEPNEAGGITPSHPLERKTGDAPQVPGTNEIQDQDGNMLMRLPFAKDGTCQKAAS